jgi:hypothetical protein
VLVGGAQLLIASIEGFRLHSNLVRRRFAFT